MTADRERPRPQLEARLARVEKALDAISREVPAIRGDAAASDLLRQIGLALALLAATTAVVGATNYFDIGARVLAYLVTSAFLLGIAYWYRRPGTAASAQTG